MLTRISPIRAVANLRDQPFRAVGGPQGDPIATIEAEIEQPGGQAVDAAGELAVGPAVAGLPENGGRPVAMSAHRLLQETRDRGFDQGLLAVSPDMREPVDRNDSVPAGHQRLRQSSACSKAAAAR